MHRLLHSLSLCLLVLSARAEIQVLNLQQAVNRALQQNPDLALARLDEQKAANAVRLAKAPFSPSLYAGSGLAYSSGFPMSIDGSAPSIFQARARQDIFNRQQSYMVASARETARARQRVEELTADQDAAERALAVVLGFSADDQVRASTDDPRTPELPADEGSAIQSAMQSSKELKRLESALIAKGLDVRAQKAARLPTVDVLA